MTARRPLRKYLISSALGLAAAGSLGAALFVGAPPAKAQFTVFDPTNYSQNLLTAARSLTQINNQIQSLQNQAQSLINQAKNLTRIDFPELQAITQTLQQIDRLMGQAQGITFKVENVDQQFQSLFPKDLNAALTSNGQVIAAKSRLDASMAAYQQTMGVQAQVVTNVQTDAQTLSALMAKSQNADGALQAAQATNQLLALTAKQLFQIQNLMAAQFRAQAIDQASRAQSTSDGRSATTKFLGSGTAYTPR
ncbi:MAG: type secretion system protein TrbJ [Bradyrhizobium sp.]|nr:type secretion system protein TrbJ [Bradyrhizobium sp.]